MGSCRIFLSTPIPHFWAMIMNKNDQAPVSHADDTQEKIAAGMDSLRAGKGVDGDAFFASMEAELAELERRESE